MALSTINWPLAIEDAAILLGKMAGMFLPYFGGVLVRSIYGHKLDAATTGRAKAVARTFMYACVVLGSALFAYAQVMDTPCDPDQYDCTDAHLSPSRVKHIYQDAAEVFVLCVLAGIAGTEDKRRADKLRIESQRY